MAYSNEELTLRVKHLESLIVNLILSNPNLRRGEICFNSSLHPDKDGEHPKDILPPHYTFQPQIDWSRDQISLGTIEFKSRFVPYTDA